MKALCPNCEGRGGSWYSNGCSCCEDYYLSCYVCDDRLVVTKEQFVEWWSEDEAEWEEWLSAHAEPPEQ